MLQAGNSDLALETWEKRSDPCFDPYGIITQWTGQISVDCRRWQMPQNGFKVAIICGESYVNRSS